MDRPLVMWPRRADPRPPTRSVEGLPRSSVSDGHSRGLITDWTEVPSSRIARMAPRSLHHRDDSQDAALEAREVAVIDLRLSEDV